MAVVPAGDQRAGLNGLEPKKKTRRGIVFGPRESRTESTNLRTDAPGPQNPSGCKIQSAVTACAWRRSVVKRTKEKRRKE